MFYKIFNILLIVKSSLQTNSSNENVSYINETMKKHNTKQVNSLFKITKYEILDVFKCMNLKEIQFR